MLLLGLNRTFYGIETRIEAERLTVGNSLNRTFYGIETGKSVLSGVRSGVLIVPFMELKLPFLYSLTATKSGS